MIREVGPVEYMVVAFPGNKFRGNIAPALEELTDAGTIRILDLAFVSKDANGIVTTAELEDVESDAGRAFQQIELEIGELVNEDDLQAVGDGLQLETSAAVLVWEDMWATRLKGAIREAGGVLLGLQRVPYEVVDQAMASVAMHEESKS